MSTAHRLCRRFCSKLLLACAGTALLGASGTPVQAFNPPVDRAGDVTVRIDGPSEIVSIEESFSVTVVVENEGEQAISGRVAIGLIDGWTAQPGDYAFEVAAGDTSSQTVQVQPSRQTYNGWYPVHAYVTGRMSGEPVSLHPIFLLQAKHPNPPQAERKLPWQAFPVAGESELALWQIPTHRAVVRVFEQEPETMPVGWTGSHPRNSGSLGRETATMDGVSKPALRIHPPWRDGQVGELTVEYPLELPETGDIVLRFANAVPQADQSDGVTFRVSAVPFDAPAGTVGDPLFERHVDAATWKNAEVDLSQFAGEAIRLQLTSHPGPDDNTGWDQSCWGEVVLTAGHPPERRSFPPATNDHAIVLGEGTIGDRPCTYRVWLGSRGLLDAAVGVECGQRRLFLDGFRVTVLGMRLDDPRSAAQLVTAARELNESGMTVRHHFSSPLGEFDLLVTLVVRDGVLQADFALDNVPEDQPWFHVYIEDVAAGGWSEPIDRVYAGAGNVIVNPGAYTLNFDGHRMSTSFVGADLEGGWHVVQGVDVPPSRLEVDPQTNHVSLHTAHTSRLTWIPADDVWSAARRWHDVNGLSAAGGVPEAAGRFVFDLWGGRYRESADALRRSFRYGATNSMVIWHNWQRWGYDYRLPEIYPPNPQLGTEEDMKYLIDGCRQARVHIALHDNYIDFYPDAEGFSYLETIAFHQNGRPVKAWFNRGREAQSYRYRSDAVAPFLRENLRLIKENLNPTAYFIDVWASIGPFDYWTADGQFYDRVYTRNQWGDHFAWIRELLGGNAPQISESGHDQLIGKLDGAQANHLRVGPPTEGYYQWAVWNWQCDDAERIPWFDVAHRDRFVLHGAGYSGRYQAGLDPRLHGIYSDDYMATEVLTGRPAMVPDPFGRNVIRKYWLLGEYAAALGLDRIKTVEFTSGDIHRQHVLWEGGGQVWVNRGEEDWTVEGHTLPQYGFLARVPSDNGQVLAALVRRDGQIVELAESPNMLYVNGRKPYAGRLPVTVEVRRMRALDDGKFELQLRWDCKQPVPEEFRPFLHLCDSQGEIAFQASHQPGVFDGTRTGIIEAVAYGVVPKEIRQSGGEFELRVGFYNPDSGRRLNLTGVSDSENRLRLGKLIVSGNGESPELIWEPHLPLPEADPFEERINPLAEPVDFGCVVTAAGLRLTREGGALLVTPLPTPAGETTEARLVWDRLPWALPQPTQIQYIAESGEVLRSEGCELADGRISLEIDGSVFQCRLSAP